MQTLTTCEASLYGEPMSEPAQATAQLRRESAELPPGWVCVESSAVRDGAIVRVSECPPIALTKVGGEHVAFLDICPHLGAVLSDEGEVRRGRVVCNAHGRAFRLLRDGDRLRGAERPLTQFPVVVMDGCVHVLTRPGEAAVVSDTRAMSGLKRLTRRVATAREPVITPRHAPS
jgi:nitrite reductase/ring-hydroxylating ferredoxin subunit